MSGSSLSISARRPAHHRKHEESCCVQPYSDQFFNRMGANARSSARHIVPLVLELSSPQSVIDVGCGTGAWLSAFRDHGVTDYVGVDGAYVDPTTLEIPPDAFRAADLTKPLQLERA